MEGGIPGLVVMGGDRRSTGREFESQHWILDGSFFTFICCKIALMLKRRKINEKETREGSIFQVLNRKNKRNRPGYGLYLKQL